MHYKLNCIEKTITKHSQGSVVASVGKDRWSRTFAISLVDKNGKFKKTICLREKEINDVIKFFKKNKNFKHNK